MKQQLDNTIDSGKIRAFRAHLRAIERQVARTLKDQTMCCGVTMAQCHVLLEIGELGQPSLAELAGRLLLDASTLSRTVDSLVKAGMVDREENPRNRRSILLAFTAKGRQAHDAINRLCDGYYGQFFTRIPAAEQGAFLAAVERLAGLFGEIEFAGCAPASVGMPSMEAPHD
jgi:DNA-binding MarR family transcriptional regulator